MYNEASTHKLLKGYGKHVAVNNLITIFWTWMYDTSTTSWIGCVRSQADCSDASGPDDFSAVARPGWIHVTFRFKKVWRILTRSAADMECPHRSGGEFRHACTGRITAITVATTRSIEATLKELAAIGLLGSPPPVEVLAYTP